MTSLPERAFNNCSKITSIEIPNTVKTIGAEAFYSCTEITELIIPEGVEAIERYTIYNCHALEKVVLPGTLKRIEEYGIASCRKIKEIVLPENITSLGVRAFRGLSGLTEINIPKNITTIPDELFCLCSKLEKITLHEGITHIGDRAFFGCPLTSISFPGTLVSIGDEAFSGGDNEIISIVFPDNLQSIGVEAFSESYELESVTMNDKLVHIGNDAFMDCTQLSEVIMGKNIETIGSGAFENCRLLGTIDLPSTLISIGEGAFFNCKSLESISIPEGITEIENELFMNCTKLYEITLPNSIVSLGDNCFRDCNSLDIITIPASVTSIGDKAFANCTKLNDLYSESKIAPALGTDVFEDTTDDLIIHIYCNASGYTVENGWTPTISYDIDVVFQHENLTYRITNYADKRVSVKANDELIEDAIVISPTVVFEEEIYTVTQVEVNAFNHCNKITSLTIPASVTMIGDNAFAGCTNLVEIYAERVEAPELGTDVFDGLEEITTVYVKFNATGYTVENGWIVPVIYEKEDTSIYDIDDKVNVYVINNTLFIESEMEEYIHIYSIYGHTYSFKLNIGVNKFSLPTGIYIVNGKKVIV